MSFWSSRERTAKKKHVCEYCGKSIMPNDRYFRETGVFEGEFNDYCLCARCKAVWPYLKDDFCNDLGKFFDDIVDTDILRCPTCNGWYSEMEFSDDMGSAVCECAICGKTYTIDLFVEAIMTHFTK